MKNNFSNKILLCIILSAFFVPCLSFAQNSGFQAQVQVAPNYNYSGSITGVQADVTQGEESSLGGDINVTNNASATAQAQGEVVGVSARYNTSISSGFTCALPNNPVLKDLINYATCLLSKSIVPLIFGAAMVLFIWGVVQYVIGTDDETKKKKGKTFMIWGLVSLAVMTSVWGLVRILGNTFGVNTTVIPQLNTQKSANTGNSIYEAPEQTAPSFSSEIQTMPTLPAGQIQTTNSSFSGQIRQ
ncbi:MAG TPA: pilin [Candidatus Paceibacterota bacterium]|nr:pilin [Candidatus Paceibacterota bacterium]